MRTCIDYIRKAYLGSLDGSLRQIVGARSRSHCVAVERFSDVRSDSEGRGSRPVRPAKIVGACARDVLRAPVHLVSHRGSDFVGGHGLLRDQLRLVGARAEMNKKE